jgi:hypothetical protein
MDFLHKALEQQQRLIEQLINDREGVQQVLRRVERDISELKGENEILMVFCFTLSFLKLTSNSGFRVRMLN